jgi:hypothetical protein
MANETGVVNWRHVAFSMVLILALWALILDFASDGWDYAYAIIGSVGTIALMLIPVIYRD